jgi:hypothetical protein
MAGNFIYAGISSKQGDFVFSLKGNFSSKKILSWWGNRAMSRQAIASFYIGGGVKTLKLY